MLPRKRVIGAAEASEVVEWLWAGFQVEIAVLSCPCGCSWDSGIWEHRDRPDEFMLDHLTMTDVDPVPCTRLENHWRHYQRWGHDGRNPLGGRSAALPTWLGTRP